MDLKDVLTQLDQVFNNDGDTCDFGCSEQAVPKMIVYVKESFPSYPYCVVSDWVWIDLTVSNKAMATLEERGLKPSAVYAHQVVDDEMRRDFKSVRTTLLQDFYKNCIFLSRNTAYILQGSGTRVSVNPAIFASIFQ